MSYAEKILAAGRAGGEAAGKAMQEALTHYGAIMTGLVNATPWDDLPILMAAMHLASQAMRPVVGESGRAIVDKLLENTEALAVNVGALRKESGEG